MRKQILTLLFFILLSFFITLNATAQDSRWEFGLSVGGSLTRLDVQSNPLFINDLDNGFHPNVAFRTSYRFSKGFGLTALPELAITGFTLTSTATNFLDNELFEEPLVIQTDLDLAYFRFPVMASWYIGRDKTEGKGFNLSVGLYAGVKLSESQSQRRIIGEIANDTPGPATFQFRNLDTFDSGTVFEVRRLQPLWGKNFSFELRSVTGFSNIDGTNGQDGLRTSTLTFGIGYLF